ncbi:MAG: CvpA family protein [Anaerolineae bacterium]|nr:CvpA family protein [Anaerolineae bacterium]MDW8171875.1 CvpA family protein [Anaerolineae bacterium]
MIELSVLLWSGAAFFAYVGFTRGYVKEVISLAGIMLGLFALHEFDPLIRGNLLATLPPDQRFYVQAALFLLIVLFAYQTRALGGESTPSSGGRGRDSGRGQGQNRALGALVGLVNGLMIGGSLWNFLILNQVGGRYPLDPYVIAPVPGSPSAAIVANLPLNLLTSPGSGDLLSLLVVVLFVIVLILI